MRRHATAVAALWKRLTKQSITSCAWCAHVPCQHVPECNSELGFEAWGLGFGGSRVWGLGFGV
eukprot:2451457-Rhodomonas_salina.1